MSALVVGLSGVTNGGKSTLANYLMKVLPPGTKLVKQDDYFLPEDSPLHVPCPGNVQHHNWDIISALDMDTLVKDLECLKRKNVSKANDPIFINSLKDIDWGEDIDLSTCNTSSIETIKIGRNIILIDGFTLYDDPRVRKMCQLKFFMTLPKDVCFSRRQERVYDPPDPPGYFDACVWPMYEAHLERVKEQGNVIFYDGTNDLAETFLCVLKKILAAASTIPSISQ